MNNGNQSNLISIIIPVYNVEQYLDRCLDSIVKQTYSVLDIILIDDGSKDSSSEICDTWAKKDRRIHVIHQKNSGQAAARNVGLAIAKGKYIAFVDSDDVVEPDYISTMLNAAMTHNADLVICSFFDHMKPDHMVTPLPDSIQSGLETFHSAISHDDWHYRPVWNRLYTRDLCFRGGMICSQKVVLVRMISYSIRYCLKQIVWLRCLNPSIIIWIILRVSLMRQYRSIA